MSRSRAHATGRPGRVPGTVTATGAMRPEHPAWAVFCDRLGGPEACNFREHDGQTVWDCGHDHQHTRTILAGMGLNPDEIQASIDNFCTQGAGCDCLILINLDADG